MRIALVIAIMLVLTGCGPQTYVGDEAQQQMKKNKQPKKCTDSILWTYC